MPQKIYNAYRLLLADSINTDNKWVLLLSYEPFSDRFSVITDDEYLEVDAFIRSLNGTIKEEV